MKKTIQMMLVIGMLFACPVMNAQNRALEKALKNQYKGKMKELKKENWKLFGSSHTLEVELLTHYDKLNRLGDKAVEFTGFATKFKSKTVGKQMAMNSACITYAQSAGNHVKGRMVVDMAGDGIDVEKEFEHFYAAYESSVSKEIKGELQESYSVIRDYGDGTFEMQTIFIVDEEAASQARIRAFENAMRESAMAQKHAEMVSKFIQEGFEVEQ
ncbi:MAG: hypothetical protein J6V12_05470 [Bacteroidaceae bacterium]|nr:hypothetical protein [Bacteroidaceae bacterium]